VNDFLGMLGLEAFDGFDDLVEIVVVICPELAASFSDLFDQGVAGFASLLSHVVYSAQDILRALI
jgi:hypothetical protein